MTVTVRATAGPETAEPIEIVFVPAPYLMPDTTTVVLLHRDISVKTSMDTVTVEAIGFDEGANINFNVRAIDTSKINTKTTQDGKFLVTASDATTVEVTASDSDGRCHYCTAYH